MLLLCEANKPGAAFFLHEVSSFIMAGFKSCLDLEDARGVGWVRVRSGFVNSEGLSALPSSRCQVWAGQIITCDNFATLRNKVNFFTADSRSWQLEGWMPNQRVCWIKK